MTTETAKKNTPDSDKWIADVETHWDPPEGLFTQDAKYIADVLHKESDSYKQAAERLTFYINRDGSNLAKSRIAELWSVLPKLKNLFAKNKSKKKAKTAKAATANVETYCTVEFL